MRTRFLLSRFLSSSPTLAQIGALMSCMQMDKANDTLNLNLYITEPLFLDRVLTHLFAGLGQPHCIG